MKTEYKTRATELIGSIDTKLSKVLDMLEGRIPADTNDAINLCRAMKQSIETTQNLIDLS
jgi:hypothetical protein